MRKIIFAFLLVLCLPGKVYAAREQPCELTMLAAINYVREKNLLKPLSLSREATRVAKYKCAEMGKLGYAEHFSPAYGSPADMLNAYAVPFHTVGENIFDGPSSGDAVGPVLDSWLSAPAYRENILNPAFGKAGLGRVTDDTGNSYWVALFIY